MKKFLLISSFLIAGFSSIAASNTIDEKLIRSFRQTYPNAVQVSWTEYPETNVVYFAEAGVRATIIYKKDGTLLKAIRYYKEANLPYYLVDAIREKYPEKKIYSVTEISTSFNIGYFIKLEDAKTWMTIQMDSDGISKVIEKFRKA